MKSCSKSILALFLIMILFAACGRKGSKLNVALTPYQSSPVLSSQSGWEKAMGLTEDKRITVFRSSSGAASQPVSQDELALYADPSFPHPDAGLHTQGPTLPGLSFPHSPRTLALPESNMLAPFKGAPVPTKSRAPFSGNSNPPSQPTGTPFRIEPKRLNPSMVPSLMRGKPSSPSIFVPSPQAGGSAQNSSSSAYLGPSFIATFNEVRPEGSSWVGSDHKKSLLTLRGPSPDRAVSTLNVLYDPMKYNPVSIRSDLVGERGCQMFYLLKLREPEEGQGIIPVAFIKRELSDEENSNGSSDQVTIIEITFEHRPAQNLKLVSKAPTPDVNNTIELNASSDILIWKEARWGDWNNDGIISAVDVAPLALSFGKNSTDGDPNYYTYAQYIDGNKDGIVNAGDLSPVAFHFGESTGGYAIYQADDANGTNATWFADVPRPKSDPDLNNPPFGISLATTFYSYIGQNPDPSILPGKYYRVVPSDIDWVESVGVGSAWTLVKGPSGGPTASLTANPTSGPAPLTVTLDATGSTDSWNLPDPDGIIEPLVRVPPGGLFPSGLYKTPTSSRKGLRIDIQPPDKGLGKFRVSFAPDRYIVVLRDTKTPSSVVAKEIASSTNSQVIFTYSRALNGFSAVIQPARIKEVESDPRVLYVEKDYVRHFLESPSRGLLKGGSVTRILQPSSQIVPSGIQRIGAYPNTNKGTGVGVAVIDSGISLTHPDLAANIADDVSFVPPYIDGDDDYGHGSHVAGTIAALDNTIGVVGVAPEAKLYAIKVGDSSGPSDSAIIAGIEWVIERASQIKVANMSFGSPGESRALHDAVKNLVGAGITVVAAAGNEYADSANFWPAGYPEVITVSALHDQDDSFASFSNNGPPVDLIAPGVNIFSTFTGSNYVWLSGTSMAVPHVAGCAALYIANHPGASPDEVKQALISAAEPGPLSGWPDDPDGKITYYEWDFEGDGFFDVSTDPPEPTLGVQYLVDGVYNATLRVTQGLAGQTDSSSVVINVYTPPVNNWPVAILDANPTSGNAPLLVNFDGTFSYDPDPGDSIVLYEWDFQNDESWDVTNNTGFASYTYDSAGSYTAKLQVTDQGGLTDEDFIGISVSPPVNQPPVADLTANPAVGQAPLTVGFDARGSSDPDGSIVLFEFDFESDGFYDWSNTTGTIQVIYNVEGNYTSSVRVTDDGGLTDTAITFITVLPALGQWALDTVAPNCNYWPVLAINGAGNPSIAYGETDPITGDALRTRFATWNGSQWNTQVVDPDPGTGVTPGLAYDSFGTPYLSYFDVANFDLKLAIWDGAQWISGVIDSAGDVGAWTSIVLDGADNPAISYAEYDPATGGTLGLKFAWWDGAQWNGMPVETGPNIGWLTNLAITSSGIPMIGYLDFANDLVKFAKWNGTDWDIEIVDNSGVACTTPSLALDPLENPGIAYYDRTNFDLRFAKWDGIQWNIQVVDSVGDVGDTPSLEFDSTGNPAISYYDGDNGDLKYARWDGSQWNIETVDASASNVGVFTSLGLNPLGDPMISYFNSDTGDLLAARWVP